MEVVSNYLQSERLLGLSAGIFGVLSIATGLLFYLLKPQFKIFAIAMLILGAIEAGVFITGYFYVNNQTKVETKVNAYNDAPKDFLTANNTMVEKNLKSFFILKTLYASILLILAIVLSKFDLKPLYFGIFTALIIHLAMAITIDSFGERYTKIYKKEILKLQK